MLEFLRLNKKELLHSFFDTLSICKLVRNYLSKSCITHHPTPSYSQQPR